MIGQSKFTGSWEEDLDSCISVLDTLALMCEVTVKEKFKSIPLILSGDALTYYSNNASSCTTYEDILSMLRTWYNSDDRKARILDKWQSLKLSTAMSNSSDKSEADVFRTFTAELMSLQKQLDSSYHTDQFLRDRLLTAVDVPSIQASLRDRLPRTSQQEINRIAIQLSDQKGTVGSSEVCAVWDGGEGDESYYSLGKTYGGDERRTIKTPWKGRDRSRFRKKLSPQWMRGVKGCFVCGRDHRANTLHSKEEVTAAINKLKAKHPSALLTVEDLHHVVNMAEVDAEDDCSDQDDEPTWDDEEEDTGDRALMASEDTADVERTLANSSFVHGINLDSTNMAMVTLSSHNGVKFNGVIIDTAANRKSVMSRQQHVAYQHEFNRKIPLQPHRRNLNGIGGQQEVIGEATIQIPFRNLNLVIDAVFAIIDDDRPSLLSSKDMVTNGLDISLQGRYLHVGDRKEPLSLENWSFIYRWTAASSPMVLYTEQELCRIHRHFGHRSVKSTYNILKRAKNGRLQPDNLRMLKELTKSCRTCQVNSAAPRRFKLTLGVDELRFNHSIVVDTMFIHNRPILHIVDCDVGWEVQAKPGRGTSVHWLVARTREGFRSSNSLSQIPSSLEVSEGLGALSQ